MFHWLSVFAPLILKHGTRWWTSLVRLEGTSLMINCQPPADVRDISSVVCTVPLCHRCFSLLITSHCLLRQAHHRLIKPGAQSGSFLAIHRHQLQRSAVCNGSFMVWRACPWISSSLSNLMVEVAIKPRQPNSTGRTIALQSCCSASDSISASCHSLHQQHPPRALSVLWISIISWGSRPNCSHQSFSLPGSMDRLMLSTCC